MFTRTILIASVICGMAASAMAALSWTATTSLPVGNKGAVVIAHNGYAYILGGRTSAEPNAVDEVYYAAIANDGTVGAWTATTALPGNLAVGGAHVYNGRMYYWGGWKEDFTTMNTCLYATINGNGTLGAWTTSAVTIPDATGAIAQMDSFGRGELGLGKYLYIIGGEINSGAITNKVYYSEIQPSGDYGAWTETTNLAVPTNGSLLGYWFHGSAIYDGVTNDYIYMIGGNHSGTTENHIIYNTINSNGTLGPTWTTSATTLGQARYEIGCARVDKYIFAVGGLDGTTPLAGVEMVEIDPTTGDVVAVTAETDLPEARARTHAVAYQAGGNNYILQTGGAVYSGDPYYATSHVAQFIAPIPPTPTPTSTGANGAWPMYE